MNRRSKEALEEERKKAERKRQIHTRANERYKETHYDRLFLNIPKGRKEIYKNYAEAWGMSLRAFVIRACDKMAGYEPPEGGEDE